MLDVLANASWLDEFILAIVGKRVLIAVSRAALLAALDEPVKLIVCVMAFSETTIDLPFNEPVAE